MSLLSKLFGKSSASSAAKAVEPTEYKDFRIFPEPVSAPGGHRIRARIEKDIDGETKSHEMIRADVCSNLDEAQSISLTKAKVVIDQMGDRVFG